MTPVPAVPASELSPPVPPMEWRGVLLVAIMLGLGLLAFARGYGYSRDELYFLACARHLAWGYPDQPPLVPLIARAMAALAPHSVVVLRIPAILASVATIVLTALVARECSGGRAAQMLAATTMAVSALILAGGHLLETSTLALPFWVLLIWLAQRALVTESHRLWLLIGVVAGVALMVSDLVAGLLATMLVAMLVLGPRYPFRSLWLYAGIALALAIWSPYLFWQAAHGWPELAVAHGIATGHSGTSSPRALLIPEQVILISVFLTPVWVAGLVRLIRCRDVTHGRLWALVWAILAVVIEATGGNPYYLGNMLPLLLAVGAQGVTNWVHHRPATRARLVGLAVILSLVNIPLGLPVVPVQDLYKTPIVAINSTMGDSVGWPAFVQEIATVYHRLPPSQQRHTIILASNYGEAGAVNRFGARYGLPAVYSGHMSYWYWGPPATTDTAAVAVGFSRVQLTWLCGHLQLAGHLNDRVHLHNAEQGAPVWVCSGLRVPWSKAWPLLRSFA